MSIQLDLALTESNRPQPEAISFNPESEVTPISQSQLLSSRPRTAQESFQDLVEDYDEEDFEESLLDKEKRRLEQESLKAARGVPKKPAIPVDDQ